PRRPGRRVARPRARRRASEFLRATPPRRLQRDAASARQADKLIAEFGLRIFQTGRRGDEETGRRLTTQILSPRLPFRPSPRPLLIPQSNGVRMARDLIREYLSFLRVEKGLSKNSVESYRRDLARLKAWGESRGREPQALDKKDIRQFVMSLTRGGLAPRSVGRAISAARGFYRFLLLDGHVKTDPSADIMPPQGGQKLPRFLTQEEIERLLEAPDTTTPEGVRDRALVEVLY